MTPQMPPPPSASTNPSIMPYVVYALYLASLFTSGITGIIGVVIAYINKNDAPQWIQTHYLFQIRTFWIGFLISIIGVILTFILIGWLVFLGLLIWLIIRMVKGIKYYSENRPIPNPETWTIP